MLKANFQDFLNTPDRSSHWDERLTISQSENINERDILKKLRAYQNLK